MAVRFGGSNAQRDVITQTLIEAALRGGDAALGRALASERARLRPGSPATWLVQARALDVAGAGGEAAQARDRALRLRARLLAA